jgi:predicted HTH domain antitoxin
MPKTLKINIPETVYASLKMSAEETDKLVRKMLALGAFKTRNLSFGKAAELAQMDKWNFMEYLSEEKVSVFNMYPEDFKDQLKFAHDIAKDLKI